MEVQQKGNAIKVVLLDGHAFKLDETALCEILLHESVKDRPVVVVSIAGEFRTGKSFLLNFFLRYLNAPNDPNWLGDVDSPLKQDFSWKTGSERHTTGILMWSEPFIIKRGEEEVAVLLMDTQGTFDNHSTLKDCAIIFALSTLLSSVQVYNLSSKIKESDLQHLHFFTQYGRLALESDKDVKPFQTLQFLVRDWSNEHEYSNGEEGGRKLLERTLQVSDNQQPELRRLRNHIRSCFRKIDCYLMPHPGLRARKPAFEGRLKDMEEDFQELLKNYIELLLDPKNLVVKVINGFEATGKELLEYFKAYMNIFQGDELPEPKSVYLATAEVTNLAAVAKAKDVYRRRMELICAPGQPYLKVDDLEIEHVHRLEMALDSFNQTRKMGGAKFSEQYAINLKLELEELYKDYTKKNSINKSEQRNRKIAKMSVAAVAGTAATFVSAAATAVAVEAPLALALVAAAPIAAPIAAVAAAGVAVASVAGVAWNIHKWR